MAELPLLAQMYHAIMAGFVRDGRAPHYIEPGGELGLRPEDARQADQFGARRAPSCLRREGHSC
jgi:hypothetical protein